MEDFFPTPPPAPKPRNSHTINTALVPMSMFFDRIGYYSIRAVLILYLLNHSTGIGLEREESSAINALFMGLMVFFKIVGGVLGDFLLNRKWTMFSGQVLQAIGAFSLCIPNVGGVYLGIALIALGTGLYSPNSLAQLGNSYQRNTKYIDAGFLILYAAINLGAFLSSWVAGGLGSTENYRLVFIVAGFMSLIAALLAAFTQQTPMREWPRLATSFRPSSLLYLIPILVLSVLAWTAVDLLSEPWNELMSRDTLQVAGMSIPGISLFNFNVYFSIPILCILILAAHYERLNSFLKIGLGLLTLTITGITGYVIAFPLLADPGSDVALILLPMFFISLSDSLFGPLFMSVIGRKAPVRLMGTMFGLYALSFWISNKCDDILVSALQPNLGGKIAIGLFLASLALGLAIAFWLVTSRLEKREKDSVGSEPQ